MDTEKCKIVLTVAEAGSFSAAAEQNGYTPAGISYTVDVVEKELGFSLFARSHGGVKLTRAGEQILPFIKDLVHASDRLERQASKVSDLLWGDVRIGSFSSIAMKFLPTLLEDFRKSPWTSRVRHIVLYLIVHLLTLPRPFRLAE